MLDAMKRKKAEKKNFLKENLKFKPGHPGHPGGLAGGQSRIEGSPHRGAANVSARGGSKSRLGKDHSAERS